MWHEIGPEEVVLGSFEFRHNVRQFDKRSGVRLVNNRDVFVT